MILKGILKAIPKRTFRWSPSPEHAKKPPQVISITGASGNIAYALLPRLVSGELLGPDRPVILKLIDLPEQMDALRGVAMELEDMASPLLHDVIITDSLSEGFSETEFAFLIGAKAQKKGEERSALVTSNTQIFIDNGKALNDYANRSVKVLVVGNPANTNCHIAQTHAPDLPSENFAALTMLDHLRGTHQLASKLGVDVEDIENFCIWGNHGPTMFPDCRYLKVKGKSFFDKLDHDWMYKEFMPKVKRRWAEIQDARGWTSIASPAHAALEHMKAWVHGTNGKWVSFAVVSRGEYGVPAGLVYSYPVTVEHQRWKIVPNLEIPPEDEWYLKVSEKELLNEAIKAEKIEQENEAHKK
jgi:malate dehydrogenase